MGYRRLLIKSESKWSVQMSCHLPLWWISSQTREVSKDDFGTLLRSSSSSMAYLSILFNASLSTKEGTEPVFILARYTLRPPPIILQ
jgi:hypothetical protein